MYDKRNKTSYGSWWTANSLIDDSSMTVDGKVWPKNWYSGYKGYQTLRKSVEQSINVNAVKVLAEVGTDYAVSQLQKFGITTVETEGSVNDLNSAALALGGMTHGVSTLEMAEAYAALANLGTYNSPTAYTVVKDNNGDVVMKATSEQTEVIDEGVAWIMDDILKTTVTQGIAGAAKISSQPVAGKTGTTSDDFDVWMCGFTPQYSAAVWIGNDVNIELNSGSTVAASLWSKIMDQVCQQFTYTNFPDPPSNVVYKNGEYFIKGTEQAIKKPTTTVEVEVCSVSGELPTPWCPKTTEKKFTVKNGEKASEAGPSSYCHIHNENIDKYPVSKKYRDKIRKEQEQAEQEEQNQEDKKKQDSDSKKKKEDQNKKEEDDPDSGNDETDDGSGE